MNARIGVEVPAGVPEPGRAHVAFSRAAPAYDAAARVPREIAARLLEHLEPIRIAPGRILDVGAGPGGCTDLLARRYRRARLTLVDVAPAMLREARRRAPRWRARRAYLCGDAQRLPIASETMDLVVASLLLEWCEAPTRALSELLRVLRPGGLLMVATLGPDTLTELRASWAAADAHVHVHDFADMHDVGDALVGAGFTDVVMDSDWIVERYRDLGELAAEIKALGAGNAAPGRPRGLTGRRRLAAVRDAYEAHRDEGGLLPATYEVAYAHAWRPERRSVSVGAPRMGGS